MKSIRIHDTNYDIVLYLDKNNFFGYKFNRDNTIEKINKNIFKYFDFFTCSNNYTVLPSENEYKIVLDNDTNFKHYFKGGSEDYDMFFKNNGKQVIYYKKEDLIDDLKTGLTTAFLVGSATVFISLSAYRLVELYTNNVVSNSIEVSVSNEDITSENINITYEEQEDKKIEQIVNRNLTYEDIQRCIYNSSNLNDEEKKLLDNKDLIEDVLNTVNECNVAKYDLLSCFDNIDIKTYDKDTEQSRGYYQLDLPNIIFIKDYNSLNESTMDTIAHEYVHLLQYNNCNYNLLKEACAEIISDEYFECASVNSYYQQVSVVKKLMEIIGPDPVWYYSFTGDFSLIEQQVKPYLDDEQYKEFLNCLEYDYFQVDKSLEKYSEFNALLNTLYQNKYNSDVKDDEIISLIDNDNKSLVRYYFNKKYINQENSYFEDGNNITSISMTVNEAVYNDYITVEEEVKECISSEQVYDYLKSHNNSGLTRHCTYIDGFKETAASYQNDGVKVSGYLNGEFLNNVPEEELIERGIIQSIEYYYIKDIKKLSTEQYMNNEYSFDNKLNYYPNPRKCYLAKFNEDGDIEVYVGTKTNLPTIKDRFSMIKER